MVIPLAILAALAWAPSSAFAAAPPRLSQASVTPSTGDPTTPFLVSVRYSASAGKPATAVTASAGARVAALALTSGSRTDGLWTGILQLPVGSWEVIVSATAANGSVSASAGDVTVVATGSWSAISGGTLPSLAEGPSGEGAVPSSSPAPGPAATPVPRSAAAPDPAPARSTVAAAPSQPPGRPAASADPVAEARRADDAARVRTPAAAATDSRQPAPASPTSTAAVGAGSAETAGDGLLNTVMLIGTLAVAAIALLGSAWILLAGRRERRAAAWTDPQPTDPATIAAAIVERRAVRRARLRSSDDPILAAMGLPEADTGSDSKPSSTSSGRHGAGRRRGRRKPPAS